jgi:hypothetical protein
LRYSLLGTLAIKHKFSVKQCIKKYSLSPTVFYEYTIESGKGKSVLAKFPTKESINNKKKVFNNSSISPMELERIMKIKANTLSSTKITGLKCAVVGCNNNIKQTHNIRELGLRPRGNAISVSGSQLWQDWKELEFALRRKRVLLCISCYIKEAGIRLFLNLLKLNVLEHSY